MQSPFSTGTNDRLSGLTKLKHINKTQRLDHLMQVYFRTLVYSLLKKTIWRTCTLYLIASKCSLFQRKLRYKLTFDGKAFDINFKHCSGLKYMCLEKSNFHI